MKKLSPNPPDPLILYLFPVLFAISLTGIVDGSLIVPMVEIDPSLTILYHRTPTVQTIRDVLPPLAPPVVIVCMVTIEVLAVRRSIRTAPYERNTRSRLLRAPNRIGAMVSSGWVVALVIGALIDIRTLEFPIQGEAAMYYGVSAVAMVSTGVFGYLLTYAIINEVNTRIFVPYVFPDGMVSRDTRDRPAGVTMRLMSYWFGLCFFPLLVLGLGIYTRRYVPVNEIRAYVFISVFLPATFLLTFRIGKSTQKPIRELVHATQMIADGRFDIPVRSTGNDEIGFLTDAVVDMARSLAEKERISESFGRAVDPRVRDHLLAGNIALGGVRRNATIMFCDIRGFTSYSEDKPEETVVAALNEHFSIMNNTIRSHGGMINKYLGDGFLAVFGVPLELGFPGAAAIRCALDIIEANRALNEQRLARGSKPFRLGIGIHGGPVIAGNIGSKDRSEYTVIGDTVNLASRIEGLTKRFDTEIVFTEDVAQAARPEFEVQLRDLGEIEVRGRRRPVHIWSIATENHPNG